MNKTKLLTILIMIAATSAFMKCSKETENDPQAVDKINLDTLTFQHSMKGWELYSWPNGNDWNYSLMMGTNRTKSYEEVTTNKIIVLGSDSLKLILEKLPANENIFWISKEWLERCWVTDVGNLSLPDNDTVNEIKEFCIQKNLNLGITN